MMIIVPYKSVGNLSFEDSREELRKKLNEEFDSGVNEIDGIKDYYDYFKQTELLVAYSDDNRIGAFEFYKSKLEFNGLDLLVEPFGSLLTIFSELDRTLIIEGTGFTSHKFGIGVNAPYASIEDDTFPAESVIIYKKGYYDDLFL